MSLALDRAAPLVGPARIALNHADSSIHDPAQAARLGFRGSAVGGSVHLDVFAPLLVETYGRPWFERGAVSVYFLNVIVSGEAVQAVVAPPPSPGAQTRVHARRGDNAAFLVCEGTASLGNHARSDLATRDLKLCDNSRLRMLKGVKPGKSLGRETLSVTRDQDARIASGGINEVLEWCQGPSPWGGPIASVSSTALLMYGLLRSEGVRHDRVSEGCGEAFGMFGAFEVEIVNGPVLLDRPYEVEGRVVGVGESPKTEYVWWNAIARDETGRTVARMRHLLRFLKASSELYPELQPG